MTKRYLKYIEDNIDSIKNNQTIHQKVILYLNDKININELGNVCFSNGLLSYYEFRGSILENGLLSNKNKNRL